MQIRSAHSHILGIDLIRFLCAVAVMIFHYGYWSWKVPSSTGGRILQDTVAYPELENFAWLGRFGVEIFFVISGFVIAFTASKAHSTGYFIFNRFLRLYPAAWICATITLSVSLLIGYNYPDGPVVPFFNSIVLSPFGPWIDGVYWTLGIEITFYMAIAFAILIKHIRLIEIIAMIIGCVHATTMIGYVIFEGFIFP